MDGYAVKMVKLHLGPQNYEDSREQPYWAFVRNLRKLKALALLNVSNRDLDHYLWIAGEYLVFHNDPSSEVSSSPSPRIPGELHKPSAANHFNKKSCVNEKGRSVRADRVKAEPVRVREDVPLWRGFSELAWGQVYAASLPALVRAYSRGISSPRR